MLFTRASDWLELMVIWGAAGTAFMLAVASGIAVLALTAGADASDGAIAPEGADAPEGAIAPAGAATVLVGAIAPEGAAAVAEGAAVLSLAEAAGASAPDGAIAPDGAAVVVDGAIAPAGADAPEPAAGAVVNDAVIGGADAGAVAFCSSISANIPSYVRYQRWEFTIRFPTTIFPSLSKHQACAPIHSHESFKKVPFGMRYLIPFGVTVKPGVDAYPGESGSILSAKTKLTLPALNISVRLSTSTRNLFNPFITLTLLS